MMSAYFVRKTKQYIWAVISFVLFMIVLIASSVCGLGLKFIIPVFFLQFLVVLVLIIRAYLAANDHYTKEWVTPLNHKVQPQRILDQIAHDRNWDKFYEKWGMQAICTMLLGDDEKAIQYQLQSLQSGKSNEHHVVDCLNLATYYLLQGDPSMAEQYNQKAQNYFTQIKIKKFNQLSLQKLEVSLRYVEEMLRYQRDPSVVAAYCEYLEERLITEDLCVRTRLMIHVELARCFIDTNNEHRAMEEYRLILELGKDTNLSNYVRAYAQGHQMELPCQEEGAFR